MNAQTWSRDRLLAILAADAAGYSRLMSLDGHGTVTALDAAREVFRAHIAAHAGRVIDMAGDSVLAVFETAAAAANAALAVQGRLAGSASGTPEDRRLRFRIGIHVGDVIEKPDGTVYGDGVNIAARLESLAEPGGITVSQAVHGMVARRVDAAFEDIGEQTVKNIAQPVRVYRMRPVETRSGQPTGQEGQSKTTVMVVEDDPGLLSRFCKIVVSAPEFELFAAVGNLAAARHAIAHKAPDVLITDLGLPDGSGIELIAETARRYPATNIMVITMFGDEQHVLASIEAGATGYVIKDSLPEEMLALIRQLIAGGSPISPVIARQLLKRFKAAPEPGAQAAQAAQPTQSTQSTQPAQPVDDAGLSPRESEVLSLIAKGFSFGEIARLLAVSPHTITAHVKKIYQKLAVHSRGEAVYEADKMGLLRR